MNAARVISALCGAFALAYASPSSAADPPAKTEGGATFANSLLLDRPHTIASLEAGIVALPTAPISVANRGGKTPFGSIGSGDATLQTGIHLLYRGDRDWSVGAAAFIAPSPTSDSEYVSVQSGGKELRRTHSRSYMFIGAEGRYVPIRYRWFEGWVGLVAGWVVIADRFVHDDDNPVPTILGTKEVTVRTEGFGVGVQAGADYLLTDNWVIGVALRADRWLLPTAKPNPAKDPACTSIGDCPTITGTVEAFMFGLTVGYRIPL